MRSREEWQERLKKAPALSLPVGGFRSIYSRGVTRIDKYIEWGYIKPDHNILDLGCGIGADAIGLEQWYKWEGKYMGIDAKKYCIDFNKNQHRGDERFWFVHSDIKNERYNPKGKIRTLKYKIPVKPSSTDFVMCHSFFSHTGMMKFARHYLKEIRRVLTDDGLAMTTWHFSGDKEPVTSKMTRTVYNRIDIEYEIAMMRFDIVKVTETAPKKQTKLLIRRSKT